MSNKKPKRKLFHKFMRNLSTNSIVKYRLYKHTTNLKIVEALKSYFNNGSVHSVVRLSRKMDIIKRMKEYIRTGNINEDEKRYNYLMVKDLINYGVSWYTIVVNEENRKVEKLHIPYDEVYK